MRTVLIGLGAGNADAVGRVLAPHDQALLSAPDPVTAVRLLGADRASIVLLEQQSGLELLAACRRLRERPGFADSQILAMVREQELPGIDGVLDAGANDFYVDSLGEPGLRARLRVVQNAAELQAERNHAENDRDQFFEMALDLLCIAGLDGVFRRVNPSWTATFGWSAEELCSRPWLDFVHPDDVDQTIAAGRQLDTGAAVIAFTNRYRGRDGSYRWLEWRAVPAVDRGLIYAAARDVTEQRLHQSQLEELTENLATTLNSIGDGVIAVDAQGAIARMNPVAEQLTGWMLEEAQGRPLDQVFNIINGETRHPIADLIVRVFGENTVVTLESETLLVRRDGRELPIADSCAPIRSAGQVRGAVLVFRDISAEVIAKQNHEAIQRQLLFSDRMASVGTLAAGMAHEINNPLSFVTANLDLVIEALHEMGAGSASARLGELQEMIQDAKQGAERIRKIVRGLKTFARGEQERRGIVDIREVLELSINMTFNEIRHRARLVKDFRELPLVEADDARLGQVFINLLVNAAHSIPVGMTEANEIRVVTSTDPTGRAVVEVRDTGAGILPSIIERIFDPFFTTKPVGVGTGLGLSICHNIVVGMGGELTVQSEVGRGTTFRVVLPSATAGARPTETATEAARTARIPVRRASILVVDDEPAVGVTLSRVLREHDVTVLTRAREAVELICSGQMFDVILSDLMMPEMTGMDLYKELVRRCPEAAERIVFISGGAFTEGAAAFLDAVPNERLEKPFDSKMVRALIHRFVK